VPGIGHPENLGDGGLAVDHQPMHLSERVADLVQVVLGRQPGAGDQPVIVGAALAVDEDELDGRGGGELAEQVGHEHGLAEAGQPGDHRPGDLGLPDEDRGAVLGPAQPPGGEAGWGRAGQVDPGRRQQWVAAQAALPDQARALLLGPHADAAPGVGQGAGGPLVVGQAGTGDGRDGGGHALAVDGNLGGGEAVLAGPLVPVAEAQGLGEQGPLGR